MLVDSPSVEVLLGINWCPKLGHDYINGEGHEFS